MRITIKATNIRLTAGIEKYIAKKIGGLQKFLKGTDPDEIEAFVEAGKPSKHHKRGLVFYAETNLKVLGKLYRAKAQTSDIYASIDQVKDELQREIKRFKEKKLTKDRRKERSFKKAKALSPYSRFRKS